MNGIEVWDVIIQLILEIEFLQLNASMEVIMLGMFILKRKNDGSYLPTSFSYPLIDYTYSEGGYISSSKLVGLKTVFALCNPDYDLDKMTIQTFCKGRGIGDVKLWIGNSNKMKI